MNKKIEKYIGLAMEQLKKESKLDKEFKGYIASLGPAINMSGLVPAIAFYSSRESSAKAERGRVMQWIFEILKSEKALPGIEKKNNMLELALSLDSSGKKKLEKDIMDISIALKLSIRTFSLTD
jgi:CRISPR/Cas system CMR-associated protein Cmr5 small subunit